MSKILFFTWICFTSWLKQSSLIHEKLPDTIIIKYDSDIILIKLKDCVWHSNNKK